MLDDVKHGIRQSGRSYPAIARAADLSDKTIYGLFQPDANPTVGTLSRIATVLLQTPHPQRLPCDGCVHAEHPERLDFGEGDIDVVVCRVAGGFRPDSGCAMRRAK
jgi:hypothetical protein